MAAGFVRSTRKLKQWMIDQVESGKFPGLTWDDPDRTSFRIPWKHAGKQDFRQDEDAAIFKEWAIYKNKYKVGDKEDAATWKTRLRCALNKSPEFEEVPERSQLDISEPYKVYRLVPPAEQNVKEAPIRRKRRIKEGNRDVSSEDEVESKRPSTLNLMRMEANEECEPKIASYFNHEDSGIGSSSDSPPRNSDSPQISLESSQRIPESILALTLDLNVEEVVDTTPVLEAGIYAMRVTIFYGGKEVLQKDVKSPDCKICSALPAATQPSSALMTNGMERIFLPSTDIITDTVKRRHTQNLLSFLEKGVMLASFPQGIYIQRSCQGRVFWTGPCAPLPGSNKLEKEAHVKVFDTNKFLSDLDLYLNCLGPAPKYQVTLCFGEEISDTDRKEDKLITVQVEQKFARQQMPQIMPESYTSTLCLFPESISEQLLFQVSSQPGLLNLP